MFPNRETGGLPNQRPPQPLLRRRPQPPIRRRLMENLRTLREEMLVSLLTLVELYAFTKNRRPQAPAASRQVRPKRKSSRRSYTRSETRRRPAGRQHASRPPAKGHSARTRPPAKNPPPPHRPRVAPSQKAAHTFATLDKEIAETRDSVERLGLRLLTPWTP